MRDNERVDKLSSTAQVAATIAMDKSENVKTLLERMLVQIQVQQN